jgi:hypothetical protein
LSGINVTHAGSRFNVTATVENPITFQLISGGAIDISSETDSDITQENYQSVVNDLTPDSDGRPLRERYWAEDLCIAHERFHANESLAFNRRFVGESQSWLNTQSAGNIAAVRSYLAEVPARVTSSTDTAMGCPGACEDRAYSAGGPAYLARANAIKARGDAGDYAGLSRGAKVGIGLAVGTAAGAGIGAGIGAAIGSNIPGLGAGAGAGYGAAIGAGVGLVGGLIVGLLA